MNDTTSGKQVLAAEMLVKRYPGTTALKEMSIAIGPHEIVGLVGENGAGKSTLLKSLVGLIQPDAGRIMVRGEQVRLRGVHHANQLGIGMVFQEQSLVPNISVAENILLGVEGAGARLGLYHWRSLRALAQRHLDKFEIDVSPSARTDTLTFAQRQMVEIAKALSIEERIEQEPVILLDEPTSVLEPDEVETLFRHLRRLREHASIVFVSHRLDEVLTLSDRIYVLRDGAAVAEMDAAKADAQHLHRLLIGHESSGSHYHVEDQVDRPAAEIRLSVANLPSLGHATVSFDVRAGEVLGLAGVEGSGREQVCRALFGDGAPAGGEIRMDGKLVAIRDPRSAIRIGVGFVPSERRTKGLVGPLSIAENMSITHISTICRGPFIDFLRERVLVDGWIKRLNIKSPSRSISMSALSGGNQQKVVLARWLISAGLKLLVLDHPTRGLDVGAKSEVYKLIRGLVGGGCSVLLIADTLEETIAMSHRILVMKDGAIVTELDAPADGKPDPLQIIEAML